MGVGSSGGVELWRKLIHLSLLLYPVLYWWLDDQTAMVILLGVLTAGMLGIEALRKFSPAFANDFQHRFSFALRDTEARKPTGATSFLIGIFLTTALFDPNVAILAMAVLVLADTAAALAGMTIGGIRLIGRKTLAGSLAFGLTASGVAAFGHFSFALPLGALLIAAWCVTVIELLQPLLTLDDNLLIPLGFASFVTLLS